MLVSCVKGDEVELDPFMADLVELGGKDSLGDDSYDGGMLLLKIFFKVSLD